MSLLLLLLSALVAPAFAGSSSDSASANPIAQLKAEPLPEIAETGITAFDSVFMKAKAIQDTLGKVQDRIIGAQDKIAVAVGLQEGTPIRMTMWELKQKAGGSLAVDMKDGKPYVTLGGEGTDEVKGMITAVNQGATDLAGIPADLAKLPAEVQQLVAACQAFPSQLNPQLLQQAGMNPLQLPKIAKTLANNIKAVGSTPKRIEDLGKAAQDLLTGIPQGLSATSPPEDAVALADIGKGDDKGGGKGDDKGSDKGSDKPAKEDKGGKADDSDEPVKAAKASKAAPSGSSGDWPVTPVGNMVSNARKAFKDAEVDSAAKMIGDADASLSRLSTPISSSELTDLYQTAALVHLVDGNAAAATANVVQALIINPDAKPSPELGPQYAKLQKMLLKSGVINIVQVEVTGSGQGYLSGRPIEAGSSIELPAGKQLLQHQVNGKWVSELVWVHEGAQIKL